jgi:hypothetical protein
VSDPQSVPVPRDLLERLASYAIARANQGGGKGGQMEYADYCKSVALLAGVPVATDEPADTSGEPDDVREELTEEAQMAAEEEAEMRREFEAERGWMGPPIDNQPDRHHVEMWTPDGGRTWGWQCFDAACKAESPGRYGSLQEAETAAETHQQQVASGAAQEGSQP